MINTAVQAQDTVPIINEVKAKTNPLASLKFDEIIAYTINFDSLHNQKVNPRTSVRDGHDDLSSKYVSSKTKIDTAMYADIIKLFSDTATYGDNYADCFVPRFVLQFNNKYKEVFRLTICQDCGYLVSTLPIPAAYTRYYDAQYEDDGKQVIFRRYLKGFSMEGTKKINDLCKLLKMGYCAF